MNERALPVAPSPGLALALRDGTRALHADAERAGVMPALLRGELALAPYRALLRNLHAIYAALEPALTRHAADPDVAPLFDATIFRAAALVTDLHALGDAADASSLPLQPATLTYVARLRELDAQRPALLAAHAYVRYLGDLSGGQVLARIVARAYALPPDHGTRFYAFGTPEQVAAKAGALRAGLDALPVDARATQALVTEARWAFERHTELFTQLAAAG
jgi:heme oxygenase